MNHLSAITCPEDLAIICAVTGRQPVIEEHDETLYAVVSEEEHEAIGDVRRAAMDVWLEHVAPLRRDAVEDPDSAEA